MSWPKGPAEHRRGPSASPHTSQHTHPSDVRDIDRARGGSLDPPGRSIARRALVVAYPEPLTAEAIGNSLGQRLGYTLVATGATLASLRAMDVVPDLVVIADVLGDGFGKSQGVRLARGQWPNATVGVILRAPSALACQVATFWGAGFCEDLTSLGSLDRLAVSIEEAPPPGSPAGRLRQKTAATALAARYLHRLGLVQAGLTKRQREVLALTWPLPVDPAAIGRSLRISEATVADNLRAIRRLLGVAVNDQIYEWATDFGVIGPDARPRGEPSGQERSRRWQVTRSTSRLTTSHRCRD